LSKTNIDETYIWLLQENSATIEEITSKQGNHEEKTSKYVYDKILAPLLQSGKIDRVRRGLYTAIDPITDQPVADPIIVSSKLRTPYYLGYYTALVIYGSAYSTRNEAHVCVKPKDRFKEFTYNNITYTPIYTRDNDTNIQVINYRGHEIKVCGKERLLIELIENPSYTGGWEQTLKSLETLGGLNYEKIPRILEKKDIQILIRRTGYLLELLKENSIYHRHYPEQVSEKIHHMVKGQPEYMEEDKTGTINKRWMLYVRPDFDNYLRGI
jgi:predicted transcriptional regulator of viral defense system